MTERDPHHIPEPDPYWQEDVAIGEGTFYRGEDYTIRMRLHTATERASRRHEIVPLSDAVRERIYVHAKPYILVPEIILSLGLFRQPDPSGAIGEETGSEWRGMRHEDIGHAQAWYYPTDQLLVLWECFPEERYRGSPDPAEDATLHALWSGFEGWLTTRFPDARRLATTWEDIYERPAWQAFLEERGYTKTAPAVFLKPLKTPGTQ